MWNREVEGVEKGRISEFRPRGGKDVVPRPEEGRGRAYLARSSSPVHPGPHGQSMER